MKYLSSYKLFESIIGVDTLMIFDFDDTIADSPRFEELVIKYLKENVSIKSLFTSSLDLIGRSVDDVKIENGRLYVSDPNLEIDVKGNWVRKKGRVYLVAPDKFYYSDLSIPTKLTELSSLYKKSKNKSIVTARIKTVRGKIESCLDKLGLGQPTHGLFMYPSRDESGNKVGIWKANTIIQLIKDSGFKKVEYFDDKSKIVNTVVRMVNKELPDISFIGHKIKSPEMTYLNEEASLDRFKTFYKKYQKSDHISVSDRKRLKEEGTVTEEAFLKIEDQVKKSLKVLNSFYVEDFSDLLEDMDINMGSARVKYTSVSFSLVISFVSRYAHYSSFEINISRNKKGVLEFNWETQSYIHDHLWNDVSSVVLHIIEEVEKAQETSINKAIEDGSKERVKHRYTRYSEMTLKNNNPFNVVKIEPQINIHVGYSHPKDVGDENMYGSWSRKSGIHSKMKDYIKNEVIERIFSISRVKNEFKLEQGYANYTYSDIDHTNYKILIKL